MSVAPPILCTGTRRAALRTAYELPRPDLGRVYMLVFKRYFKVGCSRRVYERFMEVAWMQHRSEPFEFAVFGSETESFRKIEKQMHVVLFEERFRARNWEPWEYYKRNPRTETALMQWFSNGSPSDLSLIEAAMRGEECDSAVPCCWKCGAPQRL